MLRVRRVVSLRPIIALFLHLFISYFFLFISLSVPSFFVLIAIVMLHTPDYSVVYTDKRRKTSARETVSAITLGFPFASLRCLSVYMWPISGAVLICVAFSTFWCCSFLLYE